MITKYDNICAICGSYRNVQKHHTLSGTANRKICDKYKDMLLLPLCDKCHDFLHDRESKIQTLCHIIGQLEFEKQMIIQGMTEDEARELFRREFGKSYL